MMMLKGWSGVASLVALVFVLTLGISVFAPVEAQTGDGTWQGVTLLYSSDLKGKIEPCG